MVEEVRIPVDASWVSFVNTYVEFERSEMGNIVLGIPLSTVSFRALWQDD